MNKGQFHNAECQELAENMPMAEQGKTLQHPLLRSTLAQQVQAPVPLQALVHDIVLSACFHFNASKTFI